MKSLLRLVTQAAIAGLLVFGGAARADVITNLNLTLASGATWSGTVTFFDNYLGMKSANGTLSGGSYATTSYNWTWWHGTGQANPQDFDGDGATYEDWLMGGGNAPNYNQYIGVSWFYGSLGSMPVLDLSPSSVYHGGLSNGDRIVAGAFVPVPTTLLLAGLGLAAIGLRRRQVR